MGCDRCNLAEVQQIRFQCSGFGFQLHCFSSLTPDTLRFGT
jgi:hypothetical protein